MDIQDGLRPPRRGLQRGPGDPVNVAPDRYRGGMTPDRIGRAGSWAPFPTVN